MDLRKLESGKWTMNKLNAMMLLFLCFGIIFASIIVALTDKEDCSKVTVPETLTINNMTYGKVVESPIDIPRIYNNTKNSMMKHHGEE